MIDGIKIKTFVLLILGSFAVVAVLGFYVLGHSPKKEALGADTKVITASTTRATALLLDETVATLDIGKQVKTKKDNYTIEIVKTNPIDGGIEVFAKAWTLNGKPIGFGEDGSIEIERFRIFNAPVLVPDGTKSTTTFKGEVAVVDNFKVDAKEALLEIVDHAISVKKQRFEDSKIEIGKVGNTTDVYYPSASAVDGAVGRDGINETWANIRAGAGTYSASTGAQDGFYYSSSATTNQYSGMYYSIITFDTSSIPDTDTISSATFAVKAQASANTFSSACTAGLYAQTTGSNTTLATTDYPNFGTTALSDTTFIVGSTFSTSAYNNFALNASGIANVSKVAPSTANTLSKFSVSPKEFVDNTAPTWASSKVCNGTTYFLESVNDPSLTVEHSAPAVVAPPIQNIIIFD
jgi:hypothetical protein